MSHKIMVAMASAALMGAVLMSGCGGGNNGGFNPGVTQYQQVDRLARPVVNEVLATFANGRHLANDTDNPTDDPNVLRFDIEAFLNHPQHARSAAVRDTIVGVLVPDVMKVNLASNGAAGYLGVETGGAVGGPFGGRRLQDDVVDTSLYVVFGTAISDLGLAPADGKNIPGLANQANDAVPGVGDNVGPHTDYQATFPYLGNPH